MNLKVPFIIVFLLSTQFFFAQESTSAESTTENIAKETAAPIDFKKQMQDLKDQEKFIFGRLWLG